MAERLRLSSVDSMQKDEALKYTVNHKKGTLFIFAITWSNVDQTLQYLAQM